MSSSENHPDVTDPARTAPAGGAGPDGGRAAAPAGSGEADLQAVPRPVLTEKQAKRATSSSVAMLLSTLFLMAVVAAFLLLAPPPPAPERQDRIDVAETAEQIRAAEGVPAVAPDVPEGWTSNYARWTTRDGVSSWDVGWVVSDDVFAGLEQAAEANPTWTAMRVKQSPAGDPVDVGGVSWTPHDPEGKDLFWVGELDGTTVVLTVTGDESVMRELAESVTAAAR